MATSLVQTVKEFKNDIDRFEEEWMKKNAENPEHYPLELPEENAGLWFEFFMHFCMTGEI